MVGLRVGVLVAVAAGNNQVKSEKLVEVEVGCRTDKVGVGVGEVTFPLDESVPGGELIFCSSGVEVLKPKVATAGRDSGRLGERYFIYANALTHRKRNSVNTTNPVVHLILPPLCHCLENSLNIF
jgi:hypothetical protein